MKYPRGGKMAPESLCSAYLRWRGPDHEITHRFDDIESKYDGRGDLLDWWTGEDRAAFDEKCDRTAEYYNPKSAVCMDHIMT